MRSRWLATALLALLAVLSWLVFHVSLPARTIGDLLAIALVLFWLGLPWMAIAFTARPVNAGARRGQ